MPPRTTPRAAAVTRTAAPAKFYNPERYCAEESVGYLMKRVMLSVVHQADKRLEVHDLTSAQWGPLLRLHKSGGSTVAELARWLQIDAGAMTRLLDRLEKKGLCKRVRSPPTGVWCRSSSRPTARLRSATCLRCWPRS